MPTQVLEAAPGRWLWTCRAGFETHLFEELAWAKAEPRLLGPALVESRPVREAPAFARMGFQVTAVAAAEPVACVQALARAGEGELAQIGKPRAAQETVAPAAEDDSNGADEGAEKQSASPRRTTEDSGARVHVQAWAPDADAFQSLQSAAASLGEAVIAQLPGGAAIDSPEQARELGAWLGQLCLLSPTRVAVGAVRARDALSLGPGGRRRMWRESGSLSRAAMKVEEALDAFGLSPGKGERCVDLGAAPGGWTQRLLARGARVIAVDPAKLAPELQRHPKLTHVQESAFSFAPDEPVDWLFCDMAWRPLEVAQLLAKWARNGWADYLVANIKLPMNDKNPVLFRVRHTLADAGWKQLRVRQLYHDRDEVTVLGRRF